jgi:hypothetical protein
VIKALNLQRKRLAVLHSAEEKQIISWDNDRGKLRLWENPPEPVMLNLQQHAPSSNSRATIFSTGWKSRCICSRYDSLVQQIQAGKKLPDDYCIHLEGSPS